MDPKFYAIALPCYKASIRSLGYWSGKLTLMKNGRILEWISESVYRNCDGGTLLSSARLWKLPLCAGRRCCFGYSA
jgi:hypothetical protein